MAQGSVAIKREKPDGAYYDQELPSKRSTDPTDHIPSKEIKRELSPVTPPPKVQVCPINVTQGDSILVKLKYKEGTTFIYNSQLKFTEIYWSMIHCGQGFSRRLVWGGGGGGGRENQNLIHTPGCTCVFTCDKSLWGGIDRYK
jgi:hypothetical protein